MSDLTPSQRVALRFFVEQPRGHMLITGEPGCGKSHLVSALQKICTSKGLRHAMVAPRGACAHIGGGETIHRRLAPLPHNRPICKVRTVIFL